MVTNGKRLTRDEIAAQLREAIVSGHFREGEHLSEANLTTRFGVSRGLIREALVQLAQEGMLIAKPNCGVRVAPSPTKAIRDLMVPLRRIIESYALCSILDDLGKEDFQKWEEILDRLKLACANRDFAATAETDIEFHRYLLTRAGQPDLLLIWQTLLGRIRPHFRKIHARYKNPMAIYHEHRDLLETFRTGDEEASMRKLKKNIG